MCPRLDKPPFLPRAKPPMAMQKIGGAPGERLRSTLGRKCMGVIMHGVP